MYDPGNSIPEKSQEEQSDYKASERGGYREENVISEEVRGKEKRVKTSCTFSRKEEHESSFNLIWSFI